MIMMENCVWIYAKNGGNKGNLKNGRSYFIMILKHLCLVFKKIPIIFDWDFYFSIKM